MRKDCHEEIVFNFFDVPAWIQCLKDRGTFKKLYVPGHSEVSLIGIASQQQLDSHGDPYLPVSEELVRSVLKFVRSSENEVKIRLVCHDGMGGVLRETEYEQEINLCDRSMKKPKNSEAVV